MGKTFTALGGGRVADKTPGPAAALRANASNARMPSQNMNMLHIRQVLSLIAISFAFAAVINAQSGRRSTGGTTTSTAPSVSGPKAVEKKPPQAARLQLLVGIDNRDPMSNIPYYVTDTVIDNCVRRLGDASEVIVTSAGRGMNRAEAIKRAKEETVRYVVWLQIGSELADAGRQQKRIKRTSYTLAIRSSNQAPRNSNSQDVVITRSIRRDEAESRRRRKTVHSFLSTR